VNLFTSGDLPSGTNSFNVPIYSVFSQETPPAIADVSDLSTTLAGLSTKAYVDSRYIILDALLSLRYSKDESDARYRLISDSYTKEEVDNRIPLTKVIRLDNGGTGGWFYIGYYIALPFSDVKMEFVGHSYNNDTNASQDAWTTMRFKYGSSTGNFQGTLKRIDSENNNMLPAIFELSKVLRIAICLVFTLYFRPYANGSFSSHNNDNPFHGCESFYEWRFTIRN
jgi:hypothetical protein